MKHQISPKLVSLIFSALVICFAVSFYILAWTEPTTGPPGDNIPAPLNTSNIEQVKIGGLILNWGTDGQTGGAEYGLAVAQGNIGIGTVSPKAALHINPSIASPFLSAGPDSYVDHGVLGYGWTAGVGDWLDITVPSINDENGFLRVTSAGNVGIGTVSPEDSKGSGGYLDAKDVWLRDANSGTGGWASEGGGLPLIKMGSESYASTGVKTITFGTPFPNGIVTVVAIFSGDVYWGHSSMIENSESKAGFQYRMRDVGDLNWIAIGH